MTSSRTWRDEVPPEEREVYARAGFGQTVGLRRPLALLVIDVTYGFTGLRGMEHEPSLQIYPNSCGPESWDAVDAIAVLTAAVRSSGFPVIYSRDVASEAGSGGVWSRTHGRVRDRAKNDAWIVEELAPADGDLVIEKTAPSIFFQQDLADHLRSLGIVDVLVTGTSTSGCVRASVVEAFSHGFGVTVVEECVFDRAPTSHRMTLFEVDQKYGDVRSLDDVVAEL